MKYWKGRIGTNKEGQIGTMDDNGFVPDSDETTKTEYDDFITIALDTMKVKTKTDIEKLIDYAKLQEWI